MSGSVRGEGEIRVQAAANGRKLTLDPIRIIDLQVPMREVESTIPCGFRMGWLDGDDEGTPFSLTAGAGCGSPWLAFSYGDRDFCFDMTEFVTQLIDKIKEGGGDA